MGTMYERVVEDLKGLEFFSNYKYRKRDYQFYYKDNGGEFTIKLRHWSVYILEKLYIDPIYEVRYKVLHQWYAPFTILDKNNFRQWSSFMFYDKGFFRDGEFIFNTEGKNYERDFAELSADMIEKASYYFPRYGTLQGCYDMEILPVLEGSKDLPDDGAEWIFIMLALCKLVAPERYQEFKKLVMERVAWLRSRREPNVWLYGDRIEEIIHYLETTDITKIK